MKTEAGAEVGVEAAEKVEVSMGYLLTYWWWAGVKEVGGT